MKNDPAALYSEHRSFLIGLAYRMLGSVAEAEDAVQEAFVRAQSAPTDDVASPRAWLATVVTRICLDQLRSARVRREQYTGDWLPEPVRTDLPGAVVQPRDPEDAESLSLAFLLLLERLSPLERAVFLLHEVFDYSHAEVAAILERDEVAVRQLMSRARAHVKEGRPRFPADPDRHRELVMRFAMAIGQGDLGGLQSLLAKDVVARSDGGGRAKAARRAVHGDDRVARFVMGLSRKASADVKFELMEINGRTGIGWSNAGGLLGVLALTVDGDRVVEIDLVVNPSKLSGISARG
ncbi:RNA polymerase sigma-70 factor [Sandaracinus amylolyticus]|uniref:RNA polymerase sigma-70 factor n=1 Tax=Sandaracinus amylolyticus TaxID=927083 RepID=UPI001F022EF4|nr:RNA polymerase sigma-70 factor [Sandaracinus amylolyticus]UJR81569.1 RNA polymerase sigma factor SigJ [Sandaracinus amylolyticus]